MVKWRFRTRRVWGLLATSCLVAGAQGAPYRAKPARHASPLAPENIQVSGTRQAALRAQPGTVNILTGAHIRQRNVRTPKDIASLVPGMTAVNATSGSTPIFSIRGVGLDDYSGSDMSGIGIYLDGVFAPYPVFYAGQIMDVQSVSVEKGPQGFTFGRSTTSGSVTIESVKPSDRFGGYADFGYGSYNTKTASLAINTPLDAHVQNRFAFSDVNGDGWQHDILSDRRFSSQDVLGLRNLTRFILDDRSQLLLNLHYTRDRGAPSMPQNTTPAPIGVGPGADANAVNAGPGAYPHREDGGGVSLAYMKRFDAGTLSLTSAIDFYHRAIEDNYDGTALHIGDDHFADRDLAQSNDMHWQSAIGTRFHYTIGLYESYDRVCGHYIGQQQDLFEDPDAVFASNFRQKNVSTGLYLNTVITLMRNLELMASGRYSFDARGFRGGTSTPSIVADVPYAFGHQVSYLDQQKDTNRLTGRVGLKYRLEPGVFVYGTISNGYKAGSYFSPAVSAPDGTSYIRPENMIAYEIGAKASLLNGRLDLDGALFDYQYHNRQTLLVAQFPGGTSLGLGSIPRARTRGGEVSTDWHTPLPGLELRGSFAYLDTAVIRTVETLRGQPLLAAVPAGSSLPFSPRFSWDATARYTLSVSPRYQVVWQASETWKDNMLDALSDPNARISKIGSLGLRMTVGPKSGRWEGAVFVDNLQNNARNSYSFTTNDGSRVQYIQTPRWVGGHFRFEF